ncbi:MAG: zinc-ribbon domain-containing protein, partial [Planctomycetales bacterium]
MIKSSFGTRCATDGEHAENHCFIHPGEVVEMPIVIECGKCKQRYSVQDVAAGKSVTCQKCQAPITVPQPPAAGGLVPLNPMGQQPAGSVPLTPTGQQPAGGLLPLTPTGVGPGNAPAQDPFASTPVQSGFPTSPGFSGPVGPAKQGNFNDQASFEMTPAKWAAIGGGGALLVLLVFGGLLMLMFGGSDKRQPTKSEIAATDGADVDGSSAPQSTATTQSPG